MSQGSSIQGCSTRPAGHRPGFGSVSLLVFLGLTCTPKGMAPESKFYDVQWKLPEPVSCTWAYNKG